MGTWNKRATLTLVPLGLAGCDGELSTLNPAGPVAYEVAWLWWAMLTGAIVLTLMVGILVMMGFGRPRAVPERRWTLALGVWFSVAILSVMLVAGLWVGERILPRDTGAVQVRVHTFQWGWRFTQPGPDGEPVETDNILYIPAGEPVVALVTSEDVIHSFWVPRLAGKIDAVPGRTNEVLLQADEPGLYEGVCAEFCGVGHALMRFQVVAYSPDNPPDALMAQPAGELSDVPPPGIQPQGATE